MSTPAAASTASTTPTAAASDSPGTAAVGATATTPAAGSPGAGAAPPAGAAAAGTSTEGKPAGEGKPSEGKPAEPQAQSDAERRLLKQLGQASAAERKAGQEVAAARAKITELEAKIAEGATAAERAKAADELESSLKDLKGAVRLLAKHGHKFEDVVKAWGSGVEEESPELAAIRKETAALREAEEKRVKAEQDAQKEREAAAAREAYAAGVKSAKDILTGEDPEFKETAAKRWRLASNPDDADEVVESALTSVRDHIAEKRKANKDYAPSEAQIRKLFVDTLDQAETYLRGKAKRYAERLAEEAKTAEAAKADEASRAVAEAGAVTPRATASTGRTLGVPANPLGTKKPEAEPSATISADVRGALPVPEVRKPSMSGGKREMGRPVQPLGR